MLGLYLINGYYNNRSPILSVFNFSVLKNVERSMKNLKLKYEVAYTKNKDTAFVELGNWVNNFIRNGKYILDNVESNSYEFNVGFIKGIYTLNGYENLNNKIVITHRNFNVLQIIQRILLRFGIY